MEKTRSKYFEYNNDVEHISLGTFALGMYYATQLNINKAKKLFDITMSEWSYLANYDLPENGLTAENDISHFNLPDVQESIDFLINDLIPSLNSESQDLIVQYGGISNFIDLYYNSAEFLKFIGIDENEYFDSDGESLAFYMNRLKIILQYSLNTNQPYLVYVR